MDLMTKIVILTTGLVGLYKAATFGNYAKKSESNGRSPLLDLLGLIFFMIMFPAIIWGFMVITNKVSNNVKKDPTPKEISKVEIKNNMSGNELLVAVAANVPNDYRRDNTLETIIDRYIKKGDYQTAAQAASFMADEYRKSNQFEKIAQVLMDQQNIESPKVSTSTVKPNTDKK